MNTFERVLKFVSEGIPVYKACKAAGISRYYFMKSLDEKQKLELKLIKYSACIGVFGNKTAHEFNLTENYE